MSPVGRLIPTLLTRPLRLPSDPGPKGSCIVVVGTDAPIDHAGCERLATPRRHGPGAHRVDRRTTAAARSSWRSRPGCVNERGIASATAPVAGRGLDPFFEAVIDATEESVLNSMLMAPTVVGRKGNTLYGLDAGIVRNLLAQATAGR